MNDGSPRTPGGDLTLVPFPEPSHPAAGERAKGRALTQRSAPPAPRPALALAEVLKSRCLRRSERSGSGAPPDVGCRARVGRGQIGGAVGPA